MDVGVRELKRRLSAYLERASRGELIRVTERGTPKAVLGPLPGRGNLEQGLREGWIRAARNVPPVSARRMVAARRSEDVLAEDRDP